MSGRFSTRVVASPLGDLRLHADDEGLVAVVFPAQTRLPAWLVDASSRAASPAGRRHPVLSGAARELDAYFAGKQRQFSTPLSVMGGTPFQREVWNALRKLPFGTTTSYQRLAEALGRPTSARAVGAAIGQNPLLLVVPCHRVIGAAGQLTGFAGGLPAKTWLLRHEGGVPGDAPDTSSRPRSPAT